MFHERIHRVAEFILNLAQHIQIGVNYQFGLGDSFNISHYNCNAKTNSWQVSLAYLF